ncbi:hypothetical protein CCP3SC15_400031 [Gammaproteobacteria bacterium]
MEQLNKIPLVVKISPELAAKLDQIQKAKQLDTLSNLVRIALSDYIDRWEREQTEAKPT